MNGASFLPCPKNLDLINNLLSDRFIQSKAQLSDSEGPMKTFHD